MFDELDKSAGLIGTVEYGIDEFLMTEDGDLWKRDEPDPTLQRCAAGGPCLNLQCGNDRTNMAACHRLTACQIISASASVMHCRS